MGPGKYKAETIMNRVEKILAGDLRTVARLIRDIDDGLREARGLLKDLYPHTGKAYVIGITGSPGVGKSTLVDRMIQHLRAPGEKRWASWRWTLPAPSAAGPSWETASACSATATDEGVFIRSHGHPGPFRRSDRHRPAGPSRFWTPWARITFWWKPWE